MDSISVIDADLDRPEHQEADARDGGAAEKQPKGVDPLHDRPREESQDEHDARCVDEEQEAYQAFVKTQLADLQTNITEAQQQLQKLQAALTVLH